MRIHSIRTEVVAHRAAQFGPGDSCRVNWHTRSTHEFAADIPLLTWGRWGRVASPSQSQEMSSSAGKSSCRIRPCRTPSFGIKGR